MSDIGGIGGIKDLSMCGAVDSGRGQGQMNSRLPLKASKRKVNQQCRALQLHHSLQRANTHF